MNSNSEQIDRAAETIQDATQVAADKAKAAVDRAADCAVRTIERIQQRPIQVIVVALLTGVALGLCLRR